MRDEISVLVLVILNFNRLPDENGHSSPLLQITDGFRHSSSQTPYPSIAGSVWMPLIV